MKLIATALAKAQMEMGKALKSSSNPHFKSKYADLASVMDACMPAFNAHGIAVISPTGEDVYGRFVETRFIHGESGEGLSCRVPLLVSKNDMQGYGSAVTYGRRYGLMSLAGIAPEDDDGNAAAAAPPKAQTSATKRSATVTGPEPKQEPPKSAEDMRLPDSWIATGKWKVTLGEQSKVCLDQIIEWGDANDGMLAAAARSVKATKYGGK